jgi:hypothetical protein
MLRNVGWQMEMRGKEGKDWRDRYSDECRRGKEMVMKTLNKWTKGKTCENRYELVERKRQYKEIMEKEKKKWQDWNAGNIKRLLRKKDAQQLWGGIRMMIQVWKQRERVDPLRAREYFKGLLGKGVGEWGLRKEKDVFRPERMWEEELDREIEMEEIHNYLRKAVGINGYPMEFWKEMCKKENISKILVKLMNKIYETGYFPLGWKTSLLHMIYKGKGNRRDPANYRGISLLSTLSKVYTGVLARRLNDWIEKRGAI